MNRPNERIVQADGVDLCVETFGDHGKAAILRLAGRVFDRTTNIAAGVRNPRRRWVPAILERSSEA